MKAKTCKHDGCNNPSWSKGFCRFHQYLRTDKKTPAKKKQKSQLKRSPIKKVSDKKAKRDAAYSVLRRDYLEKKPICEVCCSAKSTEIHHKYSGADRAKYQNDTSTWVAICRTCHTWTHENPIEARKLGLLK